MNRSLVLVIGLIEMALMASAHAAPEQIVVPDEKNPALAGLTEADSTLLLKALQNAGAKAGPDGSVSVTGFNCRRGFDLGSSFCSYDTPEENEIRIAPKAVARVSAVMDAVWKASGIKGVDRPNMQVSVQCAANGAQCVFSIGYGSNGA
jgi:hypothetical protein